MKSRRVLLQSAAALVVLSLAGPVAAQSAGPMPVVATFSILGDMVKRIGGKHIALTTLVGPDGNTHIYKPTPAAARSVSEAKVLFVNGLEFEGWLDRLIDASDFKGIRVVATQGIEPIAYEEGEGHDDHDKHDDHGKKHAEEKHHDKHDHGKHDDHEKKHAEEKHHGKHDHDKHDDHHAGHDHGAFDPHAWQSLKLAVTYVDNITAALAKADPANAATFYGNRAVYVAEIEALDREIRENMARLPSSRRTVVTSHDAFQYFGRDYGLTFLAPQGLSTESEASAQDVARLIVQMRKEKISAVFIENITNSRLLEQIAKETGASVGGTLYPGALSGPNGPAPTYLDMMKHNYRTLVEALGVS